MKKHSFILLAVLSIWALPASHARAQANDNPTGPSGMFNGNVSTGCSYDPYTGNATRSVTDIVVSGAVGKYPLAFTRDEQPALVLSLVIAVGVTPTAGR